MSKIFVSHSSHNNAAALAIGIWLRENGWGDHFLDISPSRGLIPGERWQEALKAAADRCQAVLFLISPAWRDSKWCLAEFLLAKHLNKVVFGVIIEDTPLATLPPEMTSEWQLCDLVKGAEQKPFRVSQDPIVQETDVYYSAEGLERLRLGLQKAGLDASTFPWPPPDDPERAPYPGMRALDGADAAVFFGREAEVIRGLDALRGMRGRGIERMLVILGASGSGKSSFLRAGLLPRLTRDDMHFLPLPVVRPERAVVSGTNGLVASLDMAFRRLRSPMSRTDIRRQLAKDNGLDVLLGELQALGRSRIQSSASPPTAIIPIDQAEELFGAEGRAEAETFLGWLAGTLAEPVGHGVDSITARQRAIAVVAIRSESYVRLQTEPKLAAVKPLIYALNPIARGQFKEVIEGPAARATAAGRKLVVEPALTERLLVDAEGADALPLLAFTLERLFVEHGGDGNLLLNEYEQLGGIGGSIEAAIESALREPDRAPAVPSDTTEQARRLRLGFIPWLALIDPDTGERKRRVASWQEIPEDARPLLERLVMMRLLVRDSRSAGGDKEPVIEIAHEALLRQWPALNGWLTEEANALQRLEATRRAAQEWSKNGRASAWLAHTGERLILAEELRRRADFDRLLGPDGAAYLSACRQRDDAARAEREAYLNRIAEQQARVSAEQSRTARAQRRALALLVVIGLTLAAGGIWTVMQAREVAEQSSLLLAGAAKDANDMGNYDRAMRLGIWAAIPGWGLPMPREAESQIRRAAHHSSMLMAAGDAAGDYKNGIDQAVFSSDGRRALAFSSVGKSAFVLDTDSGAVLLDVKQDQYIFNAAFSANGKYVLLASDRQAYLWDVEKHAQVAVLRGHEQAVVGAAFSKDGSLIATASEDGTARVWNSITAQPVAVLKGHKGRVTSVAFSPNGSRIVTSSSTDGTARIWETVSGKPLALVSGQVGKLFSVAFSTDGRRLVTSSSDNTARVWDPNTGEEVAQLIGHTGYVTSGVFSPDGKHVVTASNDSTARVWEVSTTQELLQLRGHDGMVFYAEFSADGERIITASDDHTARIWDARTGAELKRLVGHAWAVKCARFAPDGQRAMTCSDDGSIRFWDTSTASGVLELSGHTGAVYSAFLARGDTIVVTLSEDNTAGLWDATTGRNITQLKGHTERINDVVFSRDGRRVLSSSNDGTARLWDAKGGAEQVRFSGHDSAINSAVLNRNESRVLTISADQSAGLWDANTGQPIARFLGDLGILKDASFGPGGNSILTVFTKSIRVWEASNGKLRFKIDAGDDWLDFPSNNPVFLPNDDVLVTIETRPHAIVSRDISTGQVISRDVINLNYPRGAENAAPPSRGPQKKDPTTEKYFSLPQGHSGRVNSASLSADGRRIVTASDDHTARIWDVATGQEIGRLFHKGPVLAASFGSKDRVVVTASKDTTARIWAVPWLMNYSGGELINAVCRERLRGFATLTRADARLVPILRGTTGKDVCSPSGLFRPH